MSRPTQRRGRGLLLLAASALAAAATLAAPTGAQALKPDDVPAIGADTGRFTLPIKCKVSLPWLGDAEVITLDGTVDIEGVAPVQLRPGQKFFLSQGKGTLTLPAWLSTLGGVATIDGADAKVTKLLIGATRSTPEAVDLAKSYDLSVKDVAVKPLEPIKVSLPETGSFDVGPFVAPKDGTTQLRFQGASADVTLKSSATGLAIDVHADCVDAATGGASLLSIAVGGQPGGPTIKWQGQPLNYATPPSNQLVGIVNAPYTCSFGAGKKYKLGIAVGARIPLSIKKGTTLSFYEASGAIVIPAATVNALIADGYRTLRGGTVDQLFLTVQGASPAKPNVIPSGGLEIPSFSLTKGKEIVIPLPQSGTLGAGPFTPSASSESIIVGLGSASARLQLGTGSAETKVTCGAPSPAALLVDAAVV